MDFFLYLMRHNTLSLLDFKILFLYNLKLFVLVKVGGVAVSGWGGCGDKGAQKFSSLV